jgi:hypothetical protein
LDAHNSRRIRMSKLAITSLLAVVVMPVPADVLYDNGGADGSNGLSSGNFSFAYREVADDFVLDPTYPLYKIGGAYFSYVWDTGAAYPDIILQVSLYEDTGTGEPAMEPFWQILVDAVGHPSGDYYFSRPEVIYEAEWWEAVSVPSGTPFWVSFVPWDPAENGLWLTSAAEYGNIFGSEAHIDMADAGYPRWTPGWALTGTPYDLAFALTGRAYGARILGYVRDADGVGVPDVLLEADNGGGWATTNSEGYYELAVLDGWSGTVTPSKDYWSFEPPSRTYENVTEDQFNQDYIGEYGCVGDIDGDGDTDHADLGELLAAWASHPGDPGWNENADLDADGHVYHADLGILLADWGCTTE